MSEKKQKPPICAADIKENIKTFALKAEELHETIYRFNYLLGAGVLRRVNRARRTVYKKSAPFRRLLVLAWRRAVTRRIRRVKRAWQYFAAALPTARRELSSATKDGLTSFWNCLWDLTKRMVHRHRRHFLKIWSIAGPVAAIAAFVITVGAWMNTNFCLELIYRGESLGFIDGATVYDAAADKAVSRVVNVDNSFSVDTSPKFAIAIKGDTETMDGDALCDAILRTAGDSIAEATGLYVDGKFAGSMESESELNRILDGLKEGRYDKNDPSQRAEFVQAVETVEGLFPTASVVSKEAMAQKLTSEAVVKKTYTVQPGDTLSTIAVRNNMTTSELRAMNLAYAKTDMVRIGDELIVQKPQAFLQVKVVKTIQYTEKIDYKTVYTNNTKQLITWSVVKTRGQEGSQDIVAEVTYIDGVETSRTIVSKTVTKEPVTKVVERGTQPVYVSGSQVVQGDGVSKGKMSWPVPICSNMSRGWRSGHYALDICNGPVTVRNKPACAADGGTVVYAGWNGAYGYYVKIQHANGLSTAYAHLNALKVVKGQSVSRNQVIGLIGSTGQSTGPHLHFEVLRNGVRVNPLNYVTPGRIY